MTPTALVPARAAFAADGTPWSEAFGDVYHSAFGGLEQARHVFLGGNDLPARWAGRERFVILETGFLSSASDRRLIVSDPDRVARAIARAVVAYPVTPPPDAEAARTLLAAGSAPGR